MKDIIIQGIGVIAFILLMASYHQKNKIRILILQIFSSIVFAIHYSALSGLTGAMCNILTIIMLGMIYWFEKKEIKKKWILVIIISLLLIVVVIVSWDGIFSLFPIMATTMAMISFMLGTEKVIRIVGVVTATDWIIYGFIYNSFSSVVFNFITIISTTIAIIRNNKKEA